MKKKIITFIICVIYCNYLILYVSCLYTLIMIFKNKLLSSPYD